MITVVVCPRHLQTTQEAPRLTQPTQEVLHSLLLVAGFGKCQRSSVWALLGTFPSGSSSASVFPGVQKQQQGVLGHNALLYGALEVTAATSSCSWTPSGGGPGTPLEPEITVVVFPCHLQIT